MTTLDTAVPAADLDDELAARPDRFAELVARLNRQSVEKHFDAYADVPWDEPGYAIDHTDPRWEFPPDSPLGATQWYQSQPADVRARIGLHGIVCNMKAGYQFENVLKRGLLEYAYGLAETAPELRYAYHEVIEEAQHSLMFSEFVRRAELPAAGLSWDMKLGSRMVVRMARTFPAMFFVFVLGGEDPIDHVQRRALRGDRELNPLLERIMRIHVTEEARHLSFARQYLRNTVPTLRGWRRSIIRWRAPFILAVMASVMMRPPGPLVKAYDIPKPVLREAFGRGTPSRQEVRDSLRKVRTLLVDLGLVSRPSKLVWKAFGIWDDPPAAS